jgi:hypothetical protein
MKKSKFRGVLLGGLAALCSFGAMAQSTSVSHDFNDNQIPSAFRAGQGYFLNSDNGALKVKVGKQIWEEFSYDAALNLSSAPRVSFKIRADYYFQLNLALATPTNSNRFKEQILLDIFPSNEFMDVSFDFTGLLTTGDNQAVNAALVNSIRFIVNPACEASGNIWIDDFRVGSAAQTYPRMIHVIPQTTHVNSPQQTVLLRKLLAGSTITASSNNTGLIPNPTVGGVNSAGIAELKYTPVAGQTGTAKITVTVAQAGKSNLVFPFDITVNSNLAPTIDAVTAKTMGASQTITFPITGLTDGNTEKEQNLTITASSSDQSVVQNGKINISHSNPFTNGTVSITSEALSSGSKDLSITLTVKDNGGTSNSGVDTKSIVVPLKVYASYYKSPVISAFSNNAFAFIGQPVTVPFTVNDGNGGTNIASITATSSNTAAFDNPSVNYTPGSGSGSITYTAKNKQESIITISVTNTGAPANSNGNTTTTSTFEVKGADQALTGWVEDFGSYGVNGSNPSPQLFGADYYSSGTGGEDRVTWMKNLDAYEQKWFVEGQGAEQTLTLNSGAKTATLNVNKPNSVPRTFAGTWFSPRKLFDLRNNKYLSVTIRASQNTRVTFDIFDVNNKRYGLLPEQNVTTTDRTITFVFDKAPEDPDFDFSKVGAILFNSLVFQAFNGTFTISNLKIGDKADNAPAALPAEITMYPPANRTIYVNSNKLDVLLSDIKVMKDGIDQKKQVNLSFSSSNTSLIPNPTLVFRRDNEALIELKPFAGQTGTATITIAASSDGVASKNFTFNLDVINKNTNTSAIVTINQSVTHQVIQGIGAVPDNSYRGTIPDMGIDKQGLSMLRFDIGAEYEPGLEGDENDNSDPFVLDLSKVKYSNRYDWLKSKELGIDRVIGCVWTPPMWMKGVFAHRPQTQLGTRNSLLPEMYDEFAEYILGACLAFKNQFGYEMYSVCLQNEAEFYASSNLTATCGYTAEQAAEVVRRTYPRLKAAGLTTRIHGFDQLPAQGNVLNWFRTFNNSADVKNMFDAYSIHAYGENAIDPAQLQDAQVQAFYAECQRVDPKKELWMTETSGGPVGELGGIEEFSSIFGSFANNLSVWVPLGSGNLTTDRMRWNAMKSFSKFIRPGAVRVGTTSAGGAAGLAFKHTANNTFTVVLVNSSSNAQQVKLAGTAGLASTMHVYQTSLNVDCQYMGTTTSSDSYVVNVPARSVVTLHSKFEDVISSNEEQFTSADMSVYPNPTKGNLTVSLPSSNYNSIEVTDLSGRVVLTQTVRNNHDNVQVSLEELQKGMYIISAKGANTLRKKVVVE